MTPSIYRFFALVALSTFLVCPAKAGAVIAGDANDAFIDQSGVNDGAYDHLFNLYVGSLFGTMNSVMVEAFPLPYLAPGQQVTGASISFFLEQKNSSPNYNVQLYGLNRVSATSSTVLAPDWYTGTNDSANTLLAPTFATPSTTVNQAVSYSGANLATFVQKQYTNSAFSGQDLSTSRYIFFRLSPDNGSQGGFNNYQFASSRNPIRSSHSTLSLTISNGISNIAGRLQFSFNLPQASTTSAGVYNASTGALIRTLWNNVRYLQGTNYGVWDGKDDSGNAVATGSNYQIKLIYHNVQYVWEGMVGNTSTAQTGMQVYHAFGKMQDMAVSGNTVYYTVGYDENQNPLGTFQVGSPNAPSGMNFGYDFTDVASSINFVTSDATRTYWAKCFGGYGGSDTYIIATMNVSGNASSSFYTFPQGTALSGSNQKYASCLDFDGTANQPNPATGIAVQKSGNALFVSHGNLNLVRVFDKVQGNLLGSFTVANPGRMATTANGDVWVISGASTPVVQRYTFANGSASLKQTITGLSNPAGLSVSVDNALLLVADGGTSQQIKAYNNSTGASVWTYGTAGGMPVSGPTITTNSFAFGTQRANSADFSNEAFIAFQPDNTFWIADGGNGRALHFSINGNTLVYIDQISYMDASYQSTVDLTDATRVFNNFIEYSVNYALPLGGTNGSWKMVKNWGYGMPSDSTHNYFGYANGFNNVVTLSNGRTYGLVNNMDNNHSDLFELPANGPARPTGYSFTNGPRIYADGTLRFNVTGNSSISFYSQTLTGFDVNNNPVWGSPALLASTSLAPTDPRTWSAFPERTEVTASGMVVDYDPNQVDTGYHMGGISSGGSAWKWRSSPSVNGSYWFPQDGRFDIGDGVQYAGNYHMALGRNIVCGYHGEFWDGGEASQWLNFYDNGLLVGIFGTYGNTGTTMGSVDGFAGNSFAPTLVHGPNGKVYLYHNDESNHGGTLRWRIDGWDGITELNGTAGIGATANLSPSTSGPTVAITSPTPAATYLNGHNLSLSAEATSSGAGITAVQFFDGTTSLGTVTMAPFNVSSSGLSAGSHVITAKATDSNGVTGTSAPVSITIGAGGSSAPPPAPISLTSGTIASQSVSLNWSEPATSTTTSTIGQIISFQCDTAGDGNALTPSTVAGAPSYAAANFNLIGQASIPDSLINCVNSLGTTVPNVGLGYQVSPSGSGNSAQSLTGVLSKLFHPEVTTGNNTGTAITISNIPFASYDVVVYSLPSGVGNGTQTTTLNVSDGSSTTSIVQQSFTTQPTNYTVSTVAFGSNSSTNNSNTIVFQGLSSSLFKLQGTSIAGFQVVERPYDQGSPTSFSIERALGNGTFAAVGTASGVASSYTDTSSLSAGTAYQYRIKAINSFGTSAYSNTVSITTLASSSGSGTTPPPVTPPPPPPTTSPGFTSWQSKYFSTAQMADGTISGPTADPFGSGVPNLLAYALQLNPATARPSDVPTAVISNGHLVLTYVVPSSVTDISYIVEVSSDLTTWHSGTGFTQVTASVSGSTGQTITVQDSLPTTTQKHFMRLRVTQLP